MLIPAGTASVRVYFVGGAASATVQTDLGVLGSLSASAAIPRTADFTVQPGAAYVEIASPTSTIYINGIVALNNTQRIMLLNAGANGAKIAEFTTATNNYNSLNELKYIAPAMTVIAMTINDANGNTLAADYRSQLATVVEAALLSGSVAVELGAVSNTPQSTDGTLAAIQGAMISVANQYNLTVLSLPRLIGQTWTSANNAGYMFDSMHPTFSGYTRETVAYLALQKLITSP
jgi:hypothetical protein